MEPVLSEEAIRSYNNAYQRGCALMAGQILLHNGAPRKRPGWFARRRIAKAIAAFEAAVAIKADAWSALWCLGKLHQRLGDFPRALDYFLRAHAIKPDQPDVAREACIAAIEEGDAPAAVRLARAAIAMEPSDPGLRCNLALALLISGDLEGAAQAATDAIQRNPCDAISARVAAIIADVAAGKRSRPRRGSEF